MKDELIIHHSPSPATMMTFSLRLQREIQRQQPIGFGSVIVLFFYGVMHRPECKTFASASILGSLIGRMNLGRRWFTQSGRCRITLTPT
jgi:hypothetical protein